MGILSQISFRSWPGSHSRDLPHLLSIPRVCMQIRAHYNPKPNPNLSTVRRHSQKAAWENKARCHRHISCICGLCSSPGRSSYPISPCTPQAARPLTTPNRYHFSLGRCCLGGFVHCRWIPEFQGSFTPDCHGLRPAGQRWEQAGTHLSTWSLG